MRNRSIPVGAVDGQPVGDEDCWGLRLQQILNLMREATFANARRPVVLGPPHDLHALGVDDVDVANDAGAIVAGTPDFDPAIDALPDHPIQQQLLAVILVKLVQADKARHLAV